MRYRPAPGSVNPFEDIVLLAEDQRQKCRVCGCTNLRGCPEGCCWIAEDLCSECIDPDEVEAVLASTGSAVTERE